MKERGLWRHWSTFLLILAGNLCSSFVQSQSYDDARGDTGDTSPAALGFSGIETRHDGYVKGETPTIPQTSFSCSAQPYNPGLYADVETQCQVYHVCFEDRQESFLCGPGTNFNQRILACDFWYNFDCQDSPSFYSVNADIGKVPETVYRPGQSRDPAPQPRPPSRPSYPSFPAQQPAQPPSGGSYPPHVSVPPPPPPRPAPQPQQPRPAPQPQQPRPAPQPPKITPQPPQPPAFRPEPPRVYPQPPAPRPQQPVFRPQPQPRPEQPHVSVQPSYPRVPQGSGQPANVRPPPTHQRPPTQLEDDAGYDFDGYTPQRPVALPPPPPPPRSQPPKPVFPPVVSPPRVSRPPLTPPIIRQPEISRPRVPTIDTRSEFHPDANLKGGNVGYQPPRVPQPSSGYPSYPVAQRPIPVTQRPAPVPQRPAPVPQRPAPVHQRPAPVPQRPAPVAQRPVEKPSRPAYKPPATVQQEHVDTEYVPPQYPKQPSGPSTTYVPPPPPPPPVQQEVYVPPPVAQKPDYGRPQPPVAPSVIREHQKPAVPPPSRPQVSTGSRRPPPSRPKPVFPPASDHPNSNIKGGPGYQQPPPQIPRFEPTRISRPSAPQGGYRPAPVPQKPVTVTAVKPTVVKTPSASAHAGYKPPQQDRVKKPSDPPRTVYQPPIQVIDHPRSEIKGVAYDPPRQPTRVQSPSTQVTGVKRPQTQVQRPRAPVVVSRPQPPSLPSTSVKKTTSPVATQVYEKPAPGRVKQPSTHVQSVSRPSQPRFPSYEDHPNANVKGGSGYNQPPLQPVSRPSSPSTSYEQKTTSSNQGRGSGSGYPSYPNRGDVGSVQQQVVHQQDYKPSRSSPPSSVKTVQKITTAVKDTGSYQRPPQSNQHSVLVNKQSKPDYEAGSSYTRGPEVYPKPEFGKPHLQPVSSPSRSASVKQGSPSQNTITRSQNKPASPGSSPVSVGSGSGSDVRPDYPFNQIPGHQPPHERQVFPHRENPDHPNESLKGSGAYRPPPPAGFQAAASEVQEQKAVPEQEPEASSSLHGDTGSE